MSLRTEVDEALRDARAAIEDARRAFDLALDRQPFAARAEAGALREEALRVRSSAHDLRRHAADLRFPAPARPAAGEAEPRERPVPCASCGSDDLTRVDDDGGTPLLLCLRCGARRGA